MLFAGRFVEGDQSSYRALYDDLADSEFRELLTRAVFLISSFEPVYPLLIFLSSNLGLQKDILISIVNALITFMVLFIGSRKGLNTHALSWVFLTSHYTLQLFFEIERLKFSLFFALLSYLARRNIFLFSALMLASTLTHVSSLILYFSYYFKDYICVLLKSLIIKLKFKKRNFILVPPAVVGLAVLFIMKEHLSKKLYFYDPQFLRADIFFSLVITCAVFACVGKNRSDFFWFSLPLLVAVAFLTGDRLNLFIYYTGIYYLFISAKGRSSPAVFLLTLVTVFFGVKGIVNFYYSIDQGSWVYKF